MKNILDEIYKMRKCFNRVSFVILVCFAVCVLIFPVVFNYASEDKVQRKKAGELAEELAREFEAGDQAKGDVAEKHYQKGRDLYKAGEYSQAIEEFRLAQMIVPDYKKSEQYMENCWVKQEEEREKFSKALISQRRMKVENILDEAVDLYNKKELEESLAKFEEALAIDSGNEKALYYQKYISKKIEKKEALWSRIEERKETRETKEEVRGYLEEGLEYYKRGLYKEAIDTWEEILPLTSPADFARRKSQLLILDAKEHYMELESGEIDVQKEVERQTALINLQKEWGIPDYLKGDEDKKEDKDMSVEELEDKEELSEQARQIVNLDFEDAHLREVITHLSMVSGINIVLDETIFPEEDIIDSAGAAIDSAAEDIEDALGLEEIAEETEDQIPEATISPRVTQHLKNIPLIDALDIILRTKGLQYRLEANVIWISTPDRLVDSTMVTKIYKLATGIGATAFEEETTELETIEIDDEDDDDDE